MNKIDTEMLGQVDPVLLIGGVLLLSGGWLLYWLSINLTGAVLLGGGAFLVASEAVELAGLEPTPALVVRLLATVAGGLFGVYLFRTFHMLAFFLAGLIAGGAGWWVAMDAIRGGAAAPAWAQSDLVLAFGMPVAGIIVGGLAAMSDRLLITLVSAMLGAALTVAAVQHNLGGWPLFPLALLGFLLQYGLLRGRRGRNEDEEKADD